MRIYLSARYGRKAELCAVRDALQRAGHVVTSSWLDGPDVEECHGRESDLAYEDWNQIDDSDWFVAFSEAPDSPYGRGGRHVEFGLAIETCQMVVVGPRENVFHWMDGVEHYDTTEAFLAAMGVTEGEAV